MAEYRIPPFLSGEHHKANNPKEKQALLEQYVIWSKHDITKQYIMWLEKQLIDLQQKDEDKTDWLSVFQFKYTQAHTKGKRSVLRNLLKVLKS